MYNFFLARVLCSRYNRESSKPFAYCFESNNRYIMQELDYQFLDATVKALVDKPDAVKITREVDEMGVLLTLTVDPEDMGKIIGRQGNTAKAIRTLLRIVGMKNNARVNLKINEPGGTSSDMQSVDDAIDDLKME